MKHQRNAPCPCGSDLKWKKCCMNPRAEGVLALRRAAATYRRSEQRRKRGYRSNVTGLSTIASALIAPLIFSGLPIHKYRNY